MPMNTSTIKTVLHCFASLAVAGGLSVDSENTVHGQLAPRA